MDKISGYVNKIVYRNEDNGYSVVEIFGEGEERPLWGSFRICPRGSISLRRGL